MELSAPEKSEAGLATHSILRVAWLLLFPETPETFPAKTLSHKMPSLRRRLSSLSSETRIPPVRDVVPVARTRSHCAFPVTLSEAGVSIVMVLLSVVLPSPSCGVSSVGPLIAFGFLLIPVLTVRLFARNMRQFTILSSVFGGVASFAGFWLAYQLDWPVGPTDVVLLGVVYGLVFLTQKALGWFKTKPVRAATPSTVSVL